MKELPVTNITVAKITSWKIFFHMILEIGKAVPLMTSRRLQKKRGKNLKRQMPMIEMRTR